MNFTLPRKKRISACGITKSCHQFVFVLHGINKTVVVPFFVSLSAFLHHLGTSFPYGGLHQHTSFFHSVASPFSFGLINLSHFEFTSIAQTSSVKLNSLFIGSNISGGVPQITLSKLFSTFSLSNNFSLSNTGII
jgi:hypothetical protein